MTGMHTKFRGILLGVLITIPAIALTLWYFQIKRAIHANCCIENLARINAAKWWWARGIVEATNAQILPPIWDRAGFWELLQTNPVGNAVPSEEDLRTHLGGDLKMPVCPAGGIYTIGDVKSEVRCSIPLHKPELGGIRLRILHEADPRTGIDGATVQILDEAGRWRKGVTDMSGYVKISTWPRRPVALVVSKRGFLTWSNSIDKVKVAGDVLLRKKSDSGSN